MVYRLQFLDHVIYSESIGETLVIIAISTFITLVTALSMSAISTNGEIGGGTAYVKPTISQNKKELIIIFPLNLTGGTYFVM